MFCLQCTKWFCSLKWDLSSSLNKIDFINIGIGVELGNLGNKSIDWGYHVSRGFLSNSLFCDTKCLFVFGHPFNFMYTHGLYLSATLKFNELIEEGVSKKASLIFMEIYKSSWTNHRKVVIFKFMTKDCCIYVHDVSSSASRVRFSLWVHKFEN